jgi:hypothetical protein
MILNFICARRQGRRDFARLYQLLVLTGILYSVFGFIGLSGMASRAAWLGLSQRI